VSYTCDEDLLRAATPDIGLPASGGAERSSFVVVAGDVTKHVEIPDREPIRSGAAVWFDRFKQPFVDTHFSHIHKPQPQDPSGLGLPFVSELNPLKRQVGTPYE